MNIDPVWVPVIAALGSSFLTAGGSFGVIQWQRWRDGKSKAKAERFAAYAELHARAFSFAYRTQTFGLLKRSRSGLSEGLDVTLRIRKPVDVLELHEWLDIESRPLHDTYSRICVVGSQAVIDIATRLMEASGNLIEAAVATDEGRNRAARYIKGEVQSSEQARLVREAVEKLFKLREELAAAIRQEAGSVAVLLPMQQAELRKKDHKAIDD